MYDTTTSFDSSATDSHTVSFTKKSQKLFSGRTVPQNERNRIFYSFSIIFLTTTLSSLVVLAKCDQLMSRPSLGVIGSEPSSYSQRSRRSIVFDADYSRQPPSSVSSFPSLPHEQSAAHFYRNKRRPQQFLQRAIVDRTGASDALTSRNLVSDDQREDICKEHCTCARENSAFVTINCDFQANRQLNKVFGPNFRVPSDAKSLKIKLAASTSFSLQRGFFSNNKVNSLTIEGTYSKDGEQVEITSDAFQGNLGGYPEILVKNVFSVIVRSRAFSGSVKFTVRNSNDLIVFPDAFENAKLNGLFVGIKDLRISEKAFNSAQAKLRIESSSIENIYRFEASLQEIRFINCTIGAINGGTFDVININSIVFEGCRINVIKARAITEKLYSKHVSITGAIIGNIESEAIYGSGISELILTNNQIDTIRSNAISVTAINATIAENNIKRLENNWLRVKDWSNIIIERNQFGVFGSMILEETKQPVTCHFDGNSLTQPLPGSLNITNRYCILREISINMPCRCNLDWLESLTSHDLQSEVYCTIDDKLGHCFNSSTFNTRKYLNEVCDETKTTLDCVANMNLKKINGRFFTPDELTSDNHLVLKLIYVISACVLLCVLVVLIILIVYRCLCQKSKDTPNSNILPHVSDHLHEFSNEDLRIIQQTMQIMHKKYPKIEKEVNARTQVLLQENLSDKKCVKTISQILDLLGSASKESNDFLAFNQVLTQHLQPPLPLPLQLSSAPTTSTTDPIYSEPTVRDIDGDGFYTSSTIVPIATEGYGQTNLPEHIYAEPNCAQQPLLRNEYASPSDRNVDSMDVYTEPINNNRDRPPQITTPYSAGRMIQPRIPQYSLPTARNNSSRLVQEPTSNEGKNSDLRSVPANLPDVLNQNQTLKTQTQERAAEKPLTNVQRIAQDLQSMPKFHINLISPSLHRPHQNQHFVSSPMYTATSGTNRDLARRQFFDVPQLASPERDEDFELDMRGAAALPIPTVAGAHHHHPSVDCSSDHSGGSNETVQIDDIIEYVDA